MTKRAVFLAALAAVTLVACGEATPSSTAQYHPAAAADGEWNPLPDSPLSARRSAHVFGLDEQRVLVVGGTEAPPCPPTADCVDPVIPSQRDGAILDLETLEWEQISDAPVTLGTAIGALFDGRVYLYTYGNDYIPEAERAFVSYDPRTDEWQRLTPPPTKGITLRLTGTPEGLIAYHHSHEYGGDRRDFVYEPVSDAWTTIPADPLAPSYDRTITATDSGFVLTAQDLIDQPGSEGPSLYKAAVFENGEWRVLPASEIAGWNPLWVHYEGLVVNPTIVTVDGGDTNPYGRTYATGGMLDLSAERWLPLPDTPTEPGAFTGISALGPTSVAGGEGWVFDLRDQTWGELTRPEGAPEIDAGAAWAGDSLVVWGGARYVGNDGTLLGDGWVWRAAN